MADVRSFKPQLSSSRMFKYAKGESKDFDDKKVDDRFYNYMTASYETQDYLNDSEVFGITAPLIYQLDLLKEDIDDIHAHLSESKYTDNKQKFPVVDVTKEFYVTGTTLLEGDTTIEGFTNIKGDFKVNGSTISNLKPALEFSDSLRAKTLISSSAQISSDISGSFTALSASIATDIGNAGGGSADFSSVGENIIPDGDNTRDLGSSTKEFRNLYIDGTANLDIANIGVLNATTTAIAGIFHINKAPTSVSGNNVLLDARSQNHFVAANKTNIVGIRGAGIVGQIVTVHSTGTFTVHNTETGVSAKEQFQLPLGRDLSARGPVAHQFIYVDAYWLKLY